MLSLLLLSLLSPLAQSSNTTYQPRPYTANVDPKFIENTRMRASQFLPTPNIETTPWFDGPPGANVSAVAKYWADDFDYNQFQHEINNNFSNYIMTVPPPGGDYNRSLDIHFFHEVSDREDAIPILFLHGWPSTNLEWADIIPSLVNPPNNSLPAFNVVAPDLPGFGFSAPPSTPGLGATEHATAFVTMMQQLGYNRFVLYSTDLGFIIARRIVPNYSDRIINHISDFYLINANSTDMERYMNNQTTPEETAYISSSNNFFDMHAAYSQIHSTLPLSLAYALYDSPVGFLAWIYQLVYTADDKFQTAEQLIRRTIALYVSGPYNSIRSYKELFPEFMSFAGIKTNVPTSVLQYGGLDHYPEISSFNYVPLDWVQRVANVTYFKRHTVGGHFPAQSEPQLVIEDIWEIFANASRT